MFDGTFVRKIAWKQSAKQIKTLQNTSRKPPLNNRKLFINHPEIATSRSSRDQNTEKTLSKQIVLVLSSSLFKITFIHKRKVGRHIASSQRVACLQGRSYNDNSSQRVPCFCHSKTVHSSFCPCRTVHCIFSCQQNCTSQFLTPKPGPKTWPKIWQKCDEQLACEYRFHTLSVRE